MFSWEGLSETFSRECFASETVCTILAEAFNDYFSEFLSEKKKKIFSWIIITRPITVANPRKSYPSKVHIICCLLQPIDELLMGVASRFGYSQNSAFTRITSVGDGFLMTRRSDVNSIAVIIFPIVRNGLGVTRVPAKNRTCHTTPLRDYISLRLSPPKTTTSQPTVLEEVLPNTTIPSSFIDRNHPASTQQQYG